MNVNPNLPYTGDNMRPCCRAAEDDAASYLRWLKCEECGTVLVNVDGLNSAPAHVQPTLFDLEPEGSR